MTTCLHSCAEPGRAGMQVTVRRADQLTDPAIPRAVSEAGYRVAQEACTNVLRHSSRASAATVRIDQDADALRIRVRNPIDPAAGNGSRGRTGTGLASAGERVRRLGGTLTAGPDDHGYWLVDAVIPLRGAGPGQQS